MKKLISLGKLRSLVVATANGGANNYGCVLPGNRKAPFFDHLPQVLWACPVPGSLVGALCLLIGSQEDLDQRGYRDRRGTSSYSNIVLLLVTPKREHQQRRPAVAS